MNGSQIADTFFMTVIPLSALFVSVVGGITGFLLSGKMLREGKKKEDKSRE